MAADFDRRIANASNTLSDRDAAERTTNDVNAGVVAEDRLVDHMIRRPTEEDFDDVLTPEGNASGDIVGADVSDGTGPSNASVAGTG